MVRRCFAQSVVQKAAQAQAVGHPPTDPPLARDAFKESDQQQPEIHARGHRRAPQLRVVEPAALLFAECVELRAAQHRVQLLVERVPGGFRLLPGVKQFFLFLFLASHRHV